MAEHVTGSDLRSRADGLKTVIEGDANTFNREALVGIVNDIRGALQAAANTLEAHELHRRQTEQPQHNGAGSDDPNPGGTPRDLGAEPRAGSSSGSSGVLSAPRDHAAAGGVGPGQRAPQPPAAAEADPQREAASQRQAEAAHDDKPNRSKDKVEK